MRPVTRNAVLAVLAVLVALLALGAVPGYLKSGDPYYVTATPVDGNRTAVDASTLPGRRYPYATGALAAAGPNATGRSEPYWKGPAGVKEAFTHSPFDEFRALRAQYPAATADGAVYVAGNDTLYRLEMTQHP